MLRQAPPLPFLPKAVHGEEIVALAIFYAGGVAEGDRVAAAYGSNYDRLVQIKEKYDPENIFHLNQNIKS